MGELLYAEFNSKNENEANNIAELLWNLRPEKELDKIGYTESENDIALIQKVYSQVRGRGLARTTLRNKLKI